MKRILLITLSFLAFLSAPGCTHRSPAPTEQVPAIAQEQLAMPEGFTGTWKSYYPGGQIESEIEMKDGDVCGLVTGYHKNGKVRYQYTERGGKRMGPMTVYYGDGTVRMKYYYINGQSDGNIFSFYPNGLPQAELSQSGSGAEKRTSVTFYFDNGRISEKYSLLNGRPDGDYVSYYRNGDIKRQGKYRKGEFVGTWTEF